MGKLGLSMGYSCGIYCLLLAVISLTMVLKREKKWSIDLKKSRGLETVFRLWTFLSCILDLRLNLKS